MATSKKDVLTDAINNYATTYLKFCTSWESGLIQLMDDIVTESVQIIMSDMTFADDEKGKAEKQKVRTELINGIKMGAILKVCNEMKHPIPLVSDCYKQAQKMAYKIVGVSTSKSSKSKAKSKSELAKTLFG